MDMVSTADRILDTAQAPREVVEKTQAIVRK